eukprot:COSAG01_NODE_6322_length_3736_cov_1.729172_2_plen_58_part_01
MAACTHGAEPRPPRAWTRVAPRTPRPVATRLVSVELEVWDLRARLLQQRHGRRISAAA